MTAPRRCETDYADEKGGTLACLVHRDHVVRIFADPFRRSATLLEMKGLGLLKGRALVEAEEIEMNAADVPPKEASA